MGLAPPIEDVASLGFIAYYELRSSVGPHAKHGTVGVMNITFVPFPSPTER